eukprot:673333-Pyramimonas_sp.AAC.1
MRPLFSTSSSSLHIRFVSRRPSYPHPVKPCCACAGRGGWTVAHPPRCGPSSGRSRLEFIPSLETVLRSSHAGWSLHHQVLEIEQIALGNDREIQKWTRTTSWPDSSNVYMFDGEPSYGENMAILALMQRWQNSRHCSSNFGT